MAQEINSSDDIIDSREVIARINELEDIDDRDDLDEDELRALQVLAEQGQEFDDCPYGLVMVRDSYFQEYAQELADDIGAIPDNASWPMTCIDWEQAARELQHDYTPVTFDGVTYWARS